MKKTGILLVLLFFSHFAVAQVSQETVVADKEIRIAIQGGYSYRLGSVAKGTPAILKNYINDLKSGYSFGIDGAYFIEPTWGLGLKYSRYGSEESLTNMSITYNDGSSAYGTMSDNINITFVGPSYVSKYTLADPAHSVFGGLSLGYLSYHDRALLAGELMELKGSTFGAAFDFGYDYAISKYLIIGAQASVTGGSLSKVTQNHRGVESTTELDGENSENLSRMDISAGVRFKI